jgi:hypothetical protein
VPAARREGDREVGALGWQVDHGETRAHLERYIALLELPSDHLWVTTERRVFEGWIGRRLRSSIGGAYTYDARHNRHLILINLARLDRSQPQSIEVVVAEELIHMRDRLDGDLRRHAKHGYDRIAQRVAEITGATLEEIRAATVPTVRRPAKFTYACPACGIEVPRRKTGTWSCGRCSPRFDQRFVLQLVASR